MRRIGRYALLDLREHPGENDKIRPNKNYRVDPGEANAYIVYSDVVVEPPEGMLYEVLDRAAPEDSSHMALTMPLPGTQRVLFPRGRRRRRPRRCGAWRPWRAWKARWSSPARRDSSCPAPARRRACPASPRRRPAYCWPAPERPCSKRRKRPPRPPRPREAPRAVEAPAPAEPPQPTEPPRPAETPAPAGGAARPREREKARLSARAQAMAMQTGLNPRRSRSLQEIIDDKWRRSRIDQLGHPVPGEATGMPVENPVERAVEALRAAWRIEETRPKLAEAVGELEGMSGAIQKGAARREDDAPRPAAQRTGSPAPAPAQRGGRAGSPPRRRPRAAFGRCAPRKRPQIGGGRAQAGSAQGRHRRLRGARPGRARGAGRGRERLCRGGKAPHRPRGGDKGAALFADARRARTHQRRPCPAPGSSFPTCARIWSAPARRFRHDQAVEVLAALTLSPVTVLCGPAFAPQGRIGAGAGRGAGAGEPLPLPVRPAPLRGARRAAARAAGGQKRPRAGDDPAGKLQRDRPRTLCQLHHVAAGAAEPAPLPRPSAAHPPATRARPSPPSFWTWPLCCAWSRRAPTRPGTRSGKRRRSRSWPFRARRSTTSSAPAPKAVTEEVRGRMARLRADLAAHGVRISRRTLDAVWDFCAAAAPLLREHSPMQALDMALAHRALPALLSAAPAGSAQSHAGNGYGLGRM